MFGKKDTGLQMIRLGFLITRNLGRIGLLAWFDAVEMQELSPCSSDHPQPQE